VPNERLLACPVCGSTVAESQTTLHRNWHRHLDEELASPVASEAPTQVDVGEWPSELL
jgi:endogenous inhibitor of DNA gyrase (YacG/DUF329 family)